MPAQRGSRAEEASAENQSCIPPTAKTYNFPQVELFSNFKEFKLEDQCEDVAQLAECLLSVKEILALIPSPEQARGGSIHLSAGHTSS